MHSIPYQNGHNVGHDKLIDNDEIYSDQLRISLTAVEKSLFLDYKDPLVILLIYTYLLRRLTTFNKLLTPSNFFWMLAV